jgi:hypothetical protein
MSSRADMVLNAVVATVNRIEYYEQTVGIVLRKGDLGNWTGAADVLALGKVRAQHRFEDAGRTGEDFGVHQHPAAVGPDDEGYVTLPVDFQGTLCSTGVAAGTDVHGPRGL